MSTEPRTVVVVGASRGLGLGLVHAYLAQGWHAIATARSADSPLSALAGPGSCLQVELCDIDKQEQIDDLRVRIAGAEIDVLFVNAGISNGPEEITEDISTASLSRLVSTNALGPLKVIHALKEMVKDDGVIAVMSSNLASIENNTTGMWEGYRASKAALNTLLRSYAARQHDARAYLAISPGWVKTDMGGEDAPLDVETSVNGILQAIESRRGNSGARFINYLNEQLPW
ncbi:MAG: SDR family NAD(P)-dependent oxidoreductase [Parvibaculaceae bacterium]